jgi:hypothetical protein
MDTKEAVTGQCDHIVGLFLSPYIHEGGSDRLVHQSEGMDVDETFRFCPSCGREIGSMAAKSSLAVQTRLAP